VSVAIWDESLHRALEPGAPDPRARLDVVRAIREAGLSCGVFLAPVLPWLTDSVEHLDGALGATASAGATGVVVLPLHLRPGAREWFFAWLGREHPDLVPRYRRLYGRGSYVPAEYSRWLSARLAPLLERHGLAGAAGARVRRGPAQADGGFPGGSLPEAPAPAASTAAQEPGTSLEDSGQLALI
jgi:DNA repair photolyase